MNFHDYEKDSAELKDGLSFDPSTFKADKQVWDQPLQCYLVCGWRLHLKLIWNKIWHYYANMESVLFMFFFLAENVRRNKASVVFKTPRQIGKRFDICKAI